MNDTFVTAAHPNHLLAHSIVTHRCSPGCSQKNMSMLYRLIEYPVSLNSKSYMWVFHMADGYGSPPIFVYMYRDIFSYGKGILFRPRGLQA